MNKGNYGLACAVWSDNTHEINAVVQNVQAGMIWVNDCNQTPPFLPFGGLKNSGRGHELGSASFDSFTQERSVLVKCK